jgi:hypothetical protein
MPGKITSPVFGFGEINTGSGLFATISVIVRPDEDGFKNHITVKVPILSQVKSDYLPTFDLGFSKLPLTNGCFRLKIAKS